ncbi:glycoside hydrolase family 30 beta sandwich domain-containing protein [Lentzea sp. BCCO 10_0856]|uniref:Glycoside hydrolase family 30 beta sandwich domain-containing protein n=1 Tax=Lentzea miocenica TaxID=3095431 RepID=A0ABU4TC15_9PSEU|nr:glycoside hydrolase family 30 beta sandwich domain-containing protein [Lentzea sp. BCCO 10_0856]MDX8035716.1 glycoside hydrolase family 30 beta sandwich domain-containing protein [Lentzea sp. BCCO 10_0856]
MIPAVAVSALLLLSSPVVPAAATTATVDVARKHQRIDGFGFSEAFGRAEIMHGSQGLSAPKQREILDLLLSRTSGAGMSVLRLGIGSTAANSIQPADPGGPTATPRYVWDRDDESQVWLAQQAKAYGVNRFYANAWSAPGYMKTNGDEANGGSLCGLSGASCASGDWRRAYANYLVQYAKFYAQEGIRITDIGFTNEPDYTATYSSMRFTPAQAVEFTKVLGPIATGLKVACCDSFGWDQQAAYSKAIEADATARRIVATHAGHTYASPITGPLPTSRHTWMSEWSPNGTTWNENWDDGSGYDGFTIANAVHTALTTGNANGYVYWYGASVGATRGLIQMDGDGYHVSKRLWALANYSRFIRPDATRVGATTSNGALRLSAFRNADGSLAVVALNTGASASSVSYALRNSGISTGSATPYLTSATGSTTAQSPVRVASGTFTATVPARALITYRITP